MIAYTKTIQKLIEKYVLAIRIWFTKKCLTKSYTYFETTDPILWAMFKSTRRKKTARKQFLYGRSRPNRFPFLEFWNFAIVCAHSISFLRRIFICCLFLYLQLRAERNGIRSWHWVKTSSLEEIFIENFSCYFLYLIFKWPYNRSKMLWKKYQILK